ncbi:NAD P-binding protein [Mycena venus]|uniref:NAD P-binding protein n=1 Tax=Mycena venus TaxID=2733690 RepID=A0A8H7D7M0_9AGAR|nr:NAD P-binding protein [Mycena venus]
MGNLPNIAAVKASARPLLETQLSCPPTAKRGSPQQSAQEFYENTKARIQKIQSHLANSPRGTRLKDKVCIITGVGSLKGIGCVRVHSTFMLSYLRSDAHPPSLFAHEGAKHLYLIDFDAKNLPDLKETIEKHYPDVKATTVQGDAADEALISGICERALKEEGRLDVFFANAGIASKDPLESTTSETFMNVMRINSLSCFLAVKYASIAMKKTNESRGKSSSGGSIILTASVAGIRSGAGTIDYSASKAAVNSIAKTSVYQLQKTNIRVNSICPGLIETGMTLATFDYARQRGSDDKIGQLNPLGRFGVAEEIAQAALFLGLRSVQSRDPMAVLILLLDDSSYVNGQNVAVDGGLSSSHPVVPGRWA